MPGPMDAKRMAIAASLAGGQAPSAEGPEAPQEEAPEMQLLQQIMGGVQKISDHLDALTGAGQQEPQPPQGPPSAPGQQ